MYNRYTPQPDGSFQHKKIPDTPQRRPPPPAPPPQQIPIRPPKEAGIGSFLHQLLPQGFDTGDLIIVLLLILMAGDSQEGRSNALLTLALYFIL